MSIPYNLGIPASNHNPSVDQPNMLVNTNSTASIIAVDHVGFNTSGSGQHNQVTFNANNVPSLPTAPPVLFTNIQDGNGNNLPGSLAQIFFYSGANTKASTQYLSALIGSTFALGGIVMKWGAVTATDNTTISFPAAFPNNCFNVQITVNSATSPLPTIVTVSGSPLAGGFTPRVKDTNGVTAAPVPIFYLAIGN